MDKDLSYLAQIKDYIRKNLKKGYTKESLHWALVNQGHSKIEIEKAFEKVEYEMSKEAPVLKTKPKITYERYHSPNSPQNSQDQFKKKEEKEDIRKRTFWRKIFD
ncbi:MAG: hypothetical protein Q8P57_03430 [Candidatus Pacearchaeota archaeon]|nr:hypothetical protein [Candidatus Pacearchaeota archaeon]